MHQEHDFATDSYPHGRGYGNDYMRGGEVLGGYGYSAREEYSLPRGDLSVDESSTREGGPSSERVSESRR